MNEDVRSILQVITTTDDERLQVSSKVVADYFDRRHDNVLQAIKAIKRDIPDASFWCLHFQENKINVLGQNEEVTSEVLMTKDGFALLAMGFTGKKALAWKIRFIEAFNYLLETTMLRLKEDKTSADKMRLALMDQINRGAEYANFLSCEIAALKANQKKHRKPPSPRRLSSPTISVDLFGKLSFSWSHKLTQEEADFWQQRIVSVVHMILTVEGLKRKVKKELVQAVKDFRSQFKNSALQATDEELLRMLSDVVLEGVEKMSPNKQIN